MPGAYREVETGVWQAQRVKRQVGREQAGRAVRPGWPTRANRPPRAPLLSPLMLRGSLSGCTTGVGMAVLNARDVVSTERFRGRR